MQNKTEQLTTAIEVTARPLKDTSGILPSAKLSGSVALILSRTHGQFLSVPYCELSAAFSPYPLWLIPGGSEGTLVYKLYGCVPM